MTPLALDAAAAILFAALWLGYEPLLALLAGRDRGVNSDMVAVRAHWIRRMLRREVRIADTNILGHLLNSASFFASTNLLLIAAAAGIVFGGDRGFAQVSGLTMFAPAPTWLLQIKVGLVILTLAQGLLAFIWAIRQVNYVLALVGAAPERDEPSDPDYAAATARVLNSAVASFNRGVRGYYFGLAAASWLVSPIALLLGGAAAFGLLVWRQLGSEAAAAIRKARAGLEQPRS